MCGETHQCPNSFFFMPEFTKLSRKLPEEVAIAEQLVKVFINSFCNAIMLLSKTPAKTENFGQNLNTVEEKENKYILICSIFKPWKVFK